PLHAHEADAILILDELTDRADAPVAEMIDVVYLAVTVLELHQVAHDLEDVLAAKGSLLERNILAELVVELQAPDLREVVALRIEEEIVEEAGRGFERRGITRSQALVNFEDRFLGRVDLVLQERVPQRRTEEEVVDQ